MALIKYGYDKFYSRGYFIRTDLKNIMSNRYYIWGHSGCWNLCRFTSKNGVAENHVLGTSVRVKNCVRTLAEVLAERERGGYSLSVWD